MITLIAAVGKNLELGKNGDLVFHIKDDMKFFRETTAGHTVVMGRKTYASFPAPLKNRENAVISHTPDLSDERVKWFSSVEEAYNEYKDSEDEVFIIGGGVIYKEFLPLCDKMYLTEVDAEAEADTFFPAFDKTDFERTVVKTISGDGLTATIAQYKRK